MFSYLRQRKSHYYLRLRVPTDLLNVIPEAEILKSLRTKDLRAARLAAACLLPGWTGKTLLEYQSYFKLLQDVLGVQTIAEITHEKVRKLRDTLCLLPAILCKKHPGHGSMGFGRVQGRASEVP